MPQPIDLFELSIDLLYRIIDKAPKKYFTLEMNMMVGAAIKSIFTLALIFSLQLIDIKSISLYSITWFTQALFIKSETFFIFDGNSKTNTREGWFKISSFFQNYILLLLFFLLQGTEPLEKLLNEAEYSYIGIYSAIIFIFFSFDLLEIILLYFCKNCNCCCKQKVTDYYSPGQAQYFLKFRLIGGIIGIFIILIFFLEFKDKEENQNNGFIQIYMPIYMGSETLILIPTMIYLCRKRQKEKYVVPNKAETEEQLRNKKWYCIIIGFTYGLFEVPVSMWILYLDILIYLFCYCQNRYGKLLCISEIIEYEIVEQREQQEEQLNTITQ